MLLRSLSGRWKGISLRILEDKRKFKFYRLDSEEKDRIVRILIEALKERGEVLLAMVFGGFVKSGIFRDIDVAIFTGYSIPYGRVEEYEEELSRSLENLSRLPVDVRVVDYAPPWFRIKALEGITIVEREPAIAVRLKFKSRQEIEDLKAKLRRVESSLGACRR